MKVGQIERKTQDRIINLFQELDYTYLGNWETRTKNSSIEQELLVKFLKKKKYSEVIIQKAINQIEKIANTQNGNLYELNKKFYEMLRYGVQVKEKVGEKNIPVFLIDWSDYTQNDFYIAEEVTIQGQHEKRPDIVLYVNGIAISVLELKRSTISVSAGIRQNLDNQKDLFIKNFFITIQLVMAGNDSEGLRYGVIQTPEKYFLTWKETSNIRNLLDKHLVAVCNRGRLLELIHDFIVFDKGTKKIARHNQYFAVTESQKYLKKREGGIIWHAQGSGKSLIMIWLAKWIKENIDNSRVLIITDREELDEQIERFFDGVNEQIYRTKSSKDLLQQLDATKPWLICSLIHKFKKKYQSEDDYINELLANLYASFKAKGDVYVFVDECHRTQSGKLHDAMKKIIPNAVYMGFTGTPLLKKDKPKTLEVFGRYIHTYKFDEAVKDKVILDLIYEAREVEQFVTSASKIDKWFEAKTRGLNDYAKNELKKRWGTMQKVLSSQSRLSKIAGDILLDMAVNDRLMSGRGNALLVAGSIYEACKYYELFQSHGLKKCAIITSYIPDVRSIKGETVSDDEDTEEIEKYEIYKKMIGNKSIEDFEKYVKEQFVKEPDQMKLLIVVDKLLTGFDAPPATYLYIDKKMQDHGLFQAVCRVNRLDEEDKQYGYIIDYKDLFKSLRKSVKDYTSDAFDGYDKDDVEGLLKDRIKIAREKFINSLEMVRNICEPVKKPKDIEDYREYFCGSSSNSEDLTDTEQRRILLYKSTSSLLRSYANLSNEMDEAGFTKQEARNIKEEVEYYEDVRTEMKLASGDYIDLKAYEPDMRHLIDTYIDAEESRRVSAFDDLTILDMIVESGVDAIDNLPKNMRKNKTTVAETIENNVRRYITEKSPTNPKYFQKMSMIFETIIEERNKEAIAYEQYLKKISKFIKNLKNSSGITDYPTSIDTKTKKVLYDNLDNNEKAALEIDEAILKNKPDGWKGHPIKERSVNLIISKTLKKCGINDEKKVEEVFQIAKQQAEY